jgi:amidase
MSDALIRLPATAVVAALRAGQVSPLELIDAAAARIEATDSAVNALPTLCLDRARDHARALMTGKRREASGERGWLGGLPVVIKDLIDVAGVRTTYGSPLFADHVPTASHPLVQRIERLGGIVIGKSNTPEFGAGGNTFNEVFGRTLNPWNTALTCGGSTGGGAVAVATGQAWLAQGSDHGGSLRGPASLCSVVGIRPSPGRVTRGTANTLFSPMSVQGPMARNVADLALFLDTMAGYDPRDPMTFDAPAESFSDAVARAQGPLRIAFTASYGGRLPVERETRDICTAAIRLFEQAGCTVEEAHPDLGPIEDVFLTLRAQQFVVDRELQIAANPGAFKPDIIWNTEHGLAQTPSRLAWAERERAGLYRRFVAFFERYDVLVTPGAATPAWDVALRARTEVGGVKLANYIAGSAITSAITVTSCPAVSLPCGFDRHGRPVGLQIIAPARREALALQAAAIFERLSGLDRLLPIDPRPGTVPPGDA